MCESVQVLAAKPMNRVPIPGIHEGDAEKGISHKLLCVLPWFIPTQRKSKADTHIRRGLSLVSEPGIVLVFCCCGETP